MDSAATIITKIGLINLEKKALLENDFKYVDSRYRNINLLMFRKCIENQIKFLPKLS